jgi:argininosuccinate lyase
MAKICAKRTVRSAIAQAYGNESPSKLTSECLPMTSNSDRANLRTYIGSQPAQLVGSGISAPVAEVPPSESLVERLWAIPAAHLVGLRQAEVIDDAAFSAVAGALMAARDASMPEAVGAREGIAALVQVIDGRIPSSVGGAATLGLSREEWLATSGALAWRGLVARVAAMLDGVRHAALTLAETHVVTIMPMYLGGHLAQPTTLAHFLGGVIEPLALARHRLDDAWDLVGRAPIGAGIGVGDVFGIDRDDMARRLGFGGIRPNTLNALASVEECIAAIDAVQAGIRPITRFAREILVWIRTDPMSFVLDDGWSSIPEDAHPTLVLANRVERLALDSDALVQSLDAARRRLASVTYGPLGAAWDDAIAIAGELEAAVTPLLASATEFFATGLVVNRAYLGNRAGRGHTTAGDLATFLMTEEQLSPSSARRIATLVLAQVKQSSLEVSGITQDMIDSAALITIGREVKVEMEALGRFLAPRRYIERRQVVGSAAPDMTRAWLGQQRAALDEDRARLKQRTEAAARALTGLTRLVEDAAAESLED